MDSFLAMISVFAKIKGRKGSVVFTHGELAQEDYPSRLPRPFQTQSRGWTSLQTCQVAQWLSLLSASLHPPLRHSCGARAFCPTAMPCKQALIDQICSLLTRQDTLEGVIRALLLSELTSPSSY